MATVRLLSELYTVVTLTAEEVMDTLDQAAVRQLQGPIVYDALLLACARKVDARLIDTMNTRHFRRVAPDLADRIVEP